MIKKVEKILSLFDNIDEKVCKTGIIFTILYI